MMGEKERLRDFADEIRGFTYAVLLGMGGSSLASDVFFPASAEGMDIWI
jgi:glucose-6-phosphate isomerase